MTEYQGNIVIKNPAVPTGPAATGRAPGVWKLSDVAYWKSQGVWPDANIIPDQFFPYVSLLLSSTSLSNANNNLFVDSSGAFNPVSRFGNTAQGAFSPYSTNWSNYFDGSGDYISGSSSNVMTGDFTVEMWAYFQGFGGGAGVYTIGNETPQRVVFYVTSGGQLAWDLYGAGTTTFGGSVPLNTWVYLTFVKSGGSVSAYLNGTLVSTRSMNYTVGNANGFFVGGSMYGYLSNFRVVNGTALYTSNFTPPTAPLTAVSGTLLLTCQSNRFRDASTNNFTLTPVGDTRVTDFGPFSPAYPGVVYNPSDITNWSGYFDGSSALTTPNSASVAMGSSDFTIEFWQNVSLCRRSMGNVTNSGWAPNGWVAGSDSGTTFRFYAYNYNAGAPMLEGTFALNTYQHVAITRSGSTWRLFIDGVLQSTVTSSVSLDSGTSERIAVGSSGWISGGTGEYTTGYISNVRIVKGTALYTANFTPPTTNLTAISGTSLLTCQNAAFTDNSTNNFAVTQNGNPTVTGNSPFNTTGYWSNYFDGSGDFLSAPSNAAFDLGSSDFTVECWFSANSFAAGFGLISRYNYTSVGLGWGLIINSATSVRFVRGNDVLLDCTVSAMSTGAWYHVAAVRNGSTLTVYLNGTQVGQSTGISNFSDAATPLQIGRTNTVTNDINGFISNARVVKGTAVYTGAFTPPTAPLTAISGTSILTCQASRFIDSSTNNFTITRNGDVSVQSFDPFYTSTIARNGGSVYFDGSGDYLTSPSSPNYAFGTGDFIVETWVYPTVQGGHGSGNNDCIIDFRPGTGGGPYGTLYLRASGTAVGWYVNTINAIIGSAVPNGAWSHIMVSRVSGSTRMFINGVQTGSTYADSTNYLQGPAWLGQFNDGVGAGWLQGYLSGTRVVKGSGVSTNFTPPTAPVNPTPATTLMLNGMNAGIYDATTINDMETVGNAQVSTSVSKFGGSSIALDGTGDYLKAPNSDVFAFRTGDFTVEMWAYFADNAATNRPLFDTGVNSNTGRLLIRQGNDAGTSNVVNAFVSGTTISSPTISFNQWTHVAVVRQSGTVKIYINGTGGTGVSASADLTQNGCLVGAFYDQLAWNFTGYIDDLRVTRGVARYTSNFTPPTQAFPTY